MQCYIILVNVQNPKLNKCLLHFINININSANKYKKNNKTYCDIADISLI